MDGAGKYLRPEITARFGWFHGALFAQIDAGMRTRELRPDIDPNVTAGLAAGIAQSVILRCRVSGDAIDMLGEAERAYPLFLVSLTGWYEFSKGTTMEIMLRTVANSLGGPSLPLNCLRHV